MDGGLREYEFNVYMSFDGRSEKSLLTSVESLCSRISKAMWRSTILHHLYQAYSHMRMIAPSLSLLWVINIPPQTTGNSLFFSKFFIPQLRCLISQERKMAIYIHLLPFLKHPYWHSQSRCTLLWGWKCSPGHQKGFLRKPSFWGCRGYRQNNSITREEVPRRVEQSLWGTEWRSLQKFEETVTYY